MGGFGVGKPHVPVVRSKLSGIRWPFLFSLVVTPRYDAIALLSPCAEPNLGRETARPPSRHEFPLSPLRARCTSSEGFPLFGAIFGPDPGTYGVRICTTTRHCSRETPFSRRRVGVTTSGAVAMPRRSGNFREVSAWPPCGLAISRIGWSSSQPCCVPSFVDWTRRPGWPSWN